MTLIISANNKEDLRSFLPEKTINYIHYLISESGCEFKIVQGRKTKLGDCRYPLRGESARITVNNNLPKIQFLVTAIHELAHLKTYHDFRKMVKPHGKEWKSNYALLFRPLFEHNMLSDEQDKIIRGHLDNIKHASTIDPILSHYIAKHEGVTLLNELEEGAHFLFNGNEFIRGSKLRKNFKIAEARTFKEYRLSGLATVDPLGKVMIIEKNESRTHQVKNLEQDQLFYYEGEQYRMLTKRRTRYLCRQEKSNRSYTFAANTIVSIEDE